jgi:hypothetical protein
MSAVENRELGFNPWIARVPSTNQSSLSTPRETSVNRSAVSASPAFPAVSIAVRANTPNAANTSCPCWRRLFTTFLPISPLPPMTTIFMLFPMVRVRQG